MSGYGITFAVPNPLQGRRKLTHNCHRRRAVIAMHKCLDSGCRATKIIGRA
jgi:hypothetical protein